MFKAMFNEVAEQEMGLAKVISNVRAKILHSEKYSVLKELYADVIGESRSEERKTFTDAVLRHSSYYVENGTDTMIACDWVKCPEDDNEHRQIRKYHYLKGDVDICEKLDTCVDRISVEVEVEKTETITYASGFTKEVPALDAEGKKITEKGMMSYIPRKKTQWGYTADTLNAIIAALDELVGE